MTGGRRPHIMEQAEITMKTALSVETIAENSSAPGAPLVPLPTDSRAYNVEETQALVFDQDAPEREDNHTCVLAVANGLRREKADMKLSLEDAARLKSTKLRSAGVAKGNKDYASATKGTPYFSNSLQVIVPKTVATNVRAGSSTRLIIPPNFLHPTTADKKVEFAIEECSGESFSAMLMAAIHAHNLNRGVALEGSKLNEFILNHEQYGLLSALMGLHVFLEAGWVTVNQNAAQPITLQSPLGGADKHSPAQITDFVSRLATVLKVVRPSPGVFNAQQQAGVKALDGPVQLARNKIVSMIALKRDDELMYFGNYDGNNTGIDPTSGDTKPNAVGKLVDLQQNAFTQLAGAYYDAHCEYHGSYFGKALTPAKAGNQAYISIHP